GRSAIWSSRRATTLTGRVGFRTEPARTQICTLSLHDALPIYLAAQDVGDAYLTSAPEGEPGERANWGFSTITKSPQEIVRDLSRDRKSTRLNSSHVKISYAVFSLKKKNDNNHPFLTSRKPNQP